MTILFNLAYLLLVKPYNSLDDGALDYVNSVFLVIVCSFMATCSAWNTKTDDRFIYGIIFDCLIGFQFLVNLIFTTG